MDTKVMSGMDMLMIMKEKDMRPPMAETMNVHVDHVADGVVRFRCDPHDGHKNPNGTVHGGYAATAMDSVLSLAIQTKLKNALSFRGTTELNIKYIRPITLGQTLYAEGRVVSMTRQTGIASGEMVDENGKIYAYASATVMIKPED